MEVVGRTGADPYSRVVPTHDALVRLREAALSQKPVSYGKRRTDSPHEFYRYPARFTPDFARAAIEAFSNPNDLVLDPFVGGGTTLVEAMRTGRRSIGADVNELASFVSTVKTTPLTDADVAELRRWTSRLPKVLNIARSAPTLNDWRIDGYLKDLDDQTTWRIRNLVALGLRSLQDLTSANQKNFGRCIILRTAQWALDMRSTVPTIDEFRATIAAHAETMIEAAASFSKEVDRNSKPVILTERLPGLAMRREVQGIEPRLVLTSPPYPGVYVIYHRWKLRGRREIAAPYWIADCNDGQGLANYTMGARVDSTSDAYFANLRKAFAELHSLVNPSTTIVQMVGFKDIADQLHRYLEIMEEVGFREVFYPELATSDDGRLWRPVPGRRWWTTTTTLQGVAPHTAREVVLLHRRA